MLLCLCLARLPLMGCLASTTSSTIAAPFDPDEHICYCLRQEHYETAVAKMGLDKDRVVHVRFTPCYPYRRVEHWLSGLHYILVEGHFLHSMLTGRCVCALGFNTQRPTVV